MPRGELELLLKDAQGERWESVMMADSLYPGDVESTVEDWSINHEVLAARFNGKPVEIKKKYHWELRRKGEVLGIYKTRKEAVEDNLKRKTAYRKDKTTKCGIPYFVQD